MCKSFFLESQADVGGKDDWWQTGELSAAFLLLVVMTSFKTTQSWS